MSGPQSAPQSHRHWAQLAEVGNVAGFKSMLWLNRWCGRGAVALALAPAMLYFMTCRPQSRRASLDFLRTHYRARPEMWRRPPGWGAVFRHFMAFGEAVGDKFEAWTRPLDPSDFVLANGPAVQRLLEDERGQLIIGSHHGNLEFCRGFVQRYRGKTINVLLYDKHARHFTRSMQAHNPDSRINIFQVDALDIALMLKLRDAVGRGEWVFIAGDRIPVTPGGRTVEVEFLGRPAPLPIGPYMLAQSLQCPVKLMFAYRDARAKVHFDVVEFAERVQLPRGQRDAELAQLAQRFASELEQRVLEAPLQWFNFYPFWSEAKA